MSYMSGESGSDEGLIIFDKRNNMPEYKGTTYELVKGGAPFDTDGLPVLNDSGGIKNDGGKIRPTLLIKSMPRAVKELLEVLEGGAREYGADNWKLVESERYDDAVLRHLIFGYFAGEKFDQKTGKHHLAHAVANLMFLLEKELSE